MITAYSPIDMDVIRNASNKYGNGAEENSKLTLLDPITKFTM